MLEPLWEPTFHPSSHGFRPGRSCHTAIAEAKRHLEDGYEWVADLDLEKFFDLVCHQRLTAKLAQRVGDRRVLVLIGRMLKAKVVLPDGVVIASEQGVPQGGLCAAAHKPPYEQRWVMRSAGSVVPGASGVDPSLSTSGETLTIEESMTLRARTEPRRDVGDEHEWSWGWSSG